MARWRDVRAKAVAEGQLDETRLSEHKTRLLAETRAYRLRELRRAHGLNQTALAERIGLTQARVSQIESGDIGTTELRTLRAYVEALGGKLEVSYQIGGERYVLS